MKKITLVLALIVLNTCVFAQNGSIGILDANSTAFGKTYTSNSRGIYSIGINPANLAFSKPAQVEVTLPLNISMRSGTDFLSINEFNYFFAGQTDDAGVTTGRHLTAEDKERLINLFKDGGNIFVDVSLINFGAVVNFAQTIGSFGVTMQDNFYTNVKLPAGIIDLVMNGNPVNKEYNINDLSVKSAYTRTYNIAYAHRIDFFPSLFKQLNFGVGFKYVAGYMYASIDNVNSSIMTNPDLTITERMQLSAKMAFSPDFGMNYDFDSTGVKKKSSLSAFPTAAGTGHGFDVGISGNINDRWLFGVAITDIGSMTWDNKAVEYSANSSFQLKDASDPALRDSLGKIFKGQGKYISSINTDLPTAVRLGATYVVRPNLFSLSSDVNIGLNDAPRNSRVARYSIGGEWNPVKWLPFLRGGFSFGGAEVFSWTVGVGLNIWRIEFNAATPDVQYLFNTKDGKRVSFAGSWRIRLD